MTQTSSQIENANAVIFENRQNNPDVIEDNKDAGLIIFKQYDTEFAHIFVAEKNRRILVLASTGFECSNP